MNLPKRGPRATKDEQIASFAAKDARRLWLLPEFGRARRKRTEARKRAQS